MGSGRLPRNNRSINVGINLPFSLIRKLLLSPHFFLFRSLSTFNSIYFTPENEHPLFLLQTFVRLDFQKIYCSTYHFFYRSVIQCILLLSGLATLKIKSRESLYIFTQQEQEYRINNLANSLLSRIKAIEIMVRAWGRVRHQKSRLLILSNISLFRNQKALLLGQKSRAS